MAEISVHLTMPAPARPAFGLDTVERRIALYTCAQPLTLSMRGNRAHLATLVEAGITRAGLDHIREMAHAYRYLSKLARTCGCPVARERVRAVWPDRKRAQLARVLAQSPAWPKLPRAGAVVG